MTLRVGVAGRGAIGSAVARQLDGGLLGLTLAAVTTRARVELRTDPTKSRNWRKVTLDSDSARLEIRIENNPDPLNPNTSRIAALSLVAALRTFSAALHGGT